MGCSPSSCDYTDEPCFAPCGLGRLWSFTKRGKVTSVTVNGRLVVTFNEFGLAAAVAGLGLVSMTGGAARKEISEGLLVRASSLTGTWARPSCTPSFRRVKLRSRPKQHGFPER